MDILQNAVRAYVRPMLESDETEIQYMTYSLQSVLSGSSLNINDMVVTSDPGEESDDELMIKYILENLHGN